DKMEILHADPVADGAVGARGDEPIAEDANQVRSGVAHWIARTSLKGFVWVVQQHDAIQRFVTNRTVGRAYQLRTGRSDRVLALSDHVPSVHRNQRLVQDMEVAVPYEQAPAAIATLRDYFLKTRKFPLMSIHIRCSAPSELWLSPAYRRAVCYLEFWKLSPAD